MKYKFKKDLPFAKAGEEVKPREWYITLDKNGNLMGVSERLSDWEATYKNLKVVKVREVIE